MENENIIAAIISFFIPGLGQAIIQKRVKEGLYFFFGWIISAILCITLPLTVIIWIWSVYDALVFKSGNET